MMPPAAFLSDHQWSLLQPLFPSTSRGRPSLDDRLILELIFLKITIRIPWYDLPSTSPSWQCCYQRYHRLKHSGLWKSLLFTLLTDLLERGSLDLLSSLQNHEITITRDSSGCLEITYPDCLKDTWQASTAILLIHLLFSDL